MAGLGLGSYLFGGIADRNAHPLRLYGVRNASSQWSSSPQAGSCADCRGRAPSPPAEVGSKTAQSLRSAEPSPSSAQIRPAWGAG
jgi:hypothetical protein